MLTIVNDGSEENRRKIEEILSASAPEIMLDRNRLCTYEMGIEIDVSIKPDSAFPPEMELWMNGSTGSWEIRFRSVLRKR